MSAKNVDKHNRFRNITVGFRVSPEENEQINTAVRLSGLPKQEYCYRKCMNRDVIVQGNPRVYKALRNELAAVLDELKRIEAGKNIDEELLDNICRLPRYLTKPRQRRSEWDMAGSDGISRVSAVFRGKSLLTNKMRII